MAIKSEEELQKALKNIHAGHRKRMRAKFTQTRSLEHFEDHEILEMLLFCALPRRNTNPIAHHLILKFGSLDKVLDASPEELQTVPGIGPKAAALLTAIPDLAHTLSDSSLTASEPLCLKGHRALSNFLRERLFTPGAKSALFYLILLDSDYNFLVALPFYTLQRKYFFNSMLRFNLSRGDRAYCIERLDSDQLDPPESASRILADLKPALNAMNYLSWDFFFFNQEQRLTRVYSSALDRPSNRPYPFSAPLPIHRE